MNKNNIALLLILNVLNLFGAAATTMPKDVKMLNEKSNFSVAVAGRLLASLPLLADDGISLDKGLSSDDMSSKALYFGTGLCTTKEMSEGIPVDFLGLVASAEVIRRTCGFGKIIQLIADSHAKTNQFVGDEEVDRLAREFREISLRVARNLGLSENYEVLLASEIDSSQEYKEIFSEIPAEGFHEYTRKQWTDMEYLARKYNTSLKLSWKMPLRKGQLHRSDETFFDEGFKKRFQRQYSFIYNRAALTFDPSRLNVCPYTSAQGEKRLLLKSDQDAEAKLAEFCAVKHRAKDRALEQTEVIAAFLERFTEAKESGGSIGARMNRIIRSVLQ